MIIITYLERYSSGFARLLAGSVSKGFTYHSSPFSVFSSRRMCECNADEDWRKSHPTGFFLLFFSSSTESQIKARKTCSGWYEIPPIGFRNFSGSMVLKNLNESTSDIKYMGVCVYAKYIYVLVIFMRCGMSCLA